MIIFVNYEIHLSTYRYNTSYYHFVPCFIRNFHGKVNLLIMESGIHSVDQFIWTFADQTDPA